MAWPFRSAVAGSIIVGWRKSDPRLAITTAMPASQRWASVLRLARWLFDPGQSPNENLLAAKSPARAGTTVYQYSTSGPHCMSLFQGNSSFHCQPVLASGVCYKKTNPSTTTEPEYKRLAGLCGCKAQWRLRRLKARVPSKELSNLNQSGSESILFWSYLLVSHC